MLSNQFLAELQIVLNAQNDIINQIKIVIDEQQLKLKNIESKLSNVDRVSEQISQLEIMMNDFELSLEDLEDSIDYLEEEDFENFEEFNPDEILKLYENRQASVSKELIKIGYKDWNSFVRQCQTYSLQKGLNPLAPYELILTENDLQTLKNESYNAQYKWDNTDFIMVGFSGVLATLTDYFLVAIPKTFTTGQYAGQKASILTGWLKKYNIKDSNDWFAQWAKTLEEICKTPYDNQKLIEGMYPKSHRFQSLGHDPILGFIFGILDIMRGTVTGFSYDKLIGVHNFDIKTVTANQNISFIEAILKHIGHLISDVATPMGLPAPLMTLFQGINIGSFGEKGRNVGQIARWMYINGYDFRHFLVTGITPAVIEIILRAYIMLKFYSEHGEAKFPSTDNPKYRSMLLSAHTIASVGNAGKIALMSGNPLAINYAEWMALFTYLIPSVKYWLFDKNRLEIEHLEKINDDNWNQLLINSEKILEKVSINNIDNITLG